MVTLAVASLVDELTDEVTGPRQTVTGMFGPPSGLSNRELASAAAVVLVSLDLVKMCVGVGLI